MDPIKITQIIEGYQNILVADAVNPQPDYTLDSKSVSRDAWRANLQKLIIEWQKQLQQVSPFYTSTKFVV